MSSMYSSEYREINVSYLLKSLYEYKILFLIITLMVTIFASYRAMLIQPIYKSEGLLKIGFYHEINNDSFIIRPLDSASDLTSKLSFIFIGKTDADGWIQDINVENEDRSNIQEYVKIESHGLSSEASANAIEQVVNYIQEQHGKILDKKNQLLQISLGIIDAEVDAITSKQDAVLSDEKSYSEKEFSSVLKTIKLMSLIDDDLGISYVSEKLQNKKYIELFLSEGYSENTSLVTDIYSPPESISPKKGLIIILGFIVGVFLSIGTIFSIKIFSANNPN